MASVLCASLLPSLSAPARAGDPRPADATVASPAARAADPRSADVASPAARAAAPLTVEVRHAGLSVEVPVTALGVLVDLTIDEAPAARTLDEPPRAPDPVAGVRWDPARLAAACDALGDDLGLAPPFEGDVDLDEDGRAVPVHPVAGEGIDCAALALRFERALARGGPRVVEAPVAPRPPRISPAEVDALARDVDLLLEAPVALDITHRGEPAGTVTLSPDDVRDALEVRVDAASSPPRLTGVLRTDALDHQLTPVLRAIGEPARDAVYKLDSSDRVKLVPARRGVRVDGANLFAQAREAAKKPERKGAAAATTGEPALSTKKAEALQIKNLVATFTTRYPKNQPRVKNIHRMAALLDGAIVEPGARFSANQHVGKRTARRGFVLAPSIGEGEIIETFGGGVSQVATTLYNAVFDAGYAVVSRKPHTRYFDRYPMGVEATLSWPRPDFVFRNDSKAGVLIKVSVTDDSVTVKLYGDTEGRKVTRFIGKPFDHTDPRVDHEPDEALPIDKPKVKDQGSKGFSVKAGRDIVFADGKKKHEERTVVYHGRPRVVAAHPCAIPKGAKGHRKKGCPKPVDQAENDALYDEVLKAASKDEGAKDEKANDRKKPAKDEKKTADKKATDKKATDKKATDKKGDAKKKKSDAAKKTARR